MSLKSTVYVIFFFTSFILSAQQQNIPLSWQFTRNTDMYYEKLQEHTSLKPLLQSRMYLHKNDSSFDASQTDAHLFRYAKNTQGHWFVRKTLYENLLKIDSGEFWLTADPLFHFSTGTDISDTLGHKISNNTRGFIIRGNIGSTFSFTSSFYENQSFFPNYINDYIESKAEWYFSKNTNQWLQRPGYGPVPGQGRTKPFKKTGYDYAFSQGYISYTPAKWINIQLGHDKHFVGDGYRSLLLSDAAFNYPFFKTTLWAYNNKLMYSVIYNSLLNLERTPNPTTPEANFRNKLGSFHYAAYRFNKIVTIGFFQGIIWQRMDSSSTKPFNFNYINPILFVNAAQYGFNNKNNVLLGNTIKIKLPFKTIIYGQFAISGTKNQTAWQTGVKYFGIKKMFVVAEYNMAAADIYKSSIPFQHYTHYYEPLAHPYGSGFNEFVFMAQYNVKRLFIDSKLIYASKEVYYNAPFTSYLGNNAQSWQTEFYSIQSTMSFIVNRRNNLHIYLGYCYRQMHEPIMMSWLTTNSLIGIINKQNNIFSIGIKTQLFNTYYDF